MPAGWAIRRVVLADAIRAVDLAAGDGDRALAEMAAAGVADPRGGGPMIRRTLATALGGLAAAVLADRWLGGLSVDDEGRPIRVPIRSRIEIDAPIAEVWARLADVERQPDWMTDLKAVRVTTPGPIGVGTRAEGQIRILGIPVADPVEIVEFAPPHRFAIRHRRPVQRERPDHARHARRRSPDPGRVGRDARPAGPAEPRLADPGPDPRAGSSRPTSSGSRRWSRPTEPKRVAPPEPGPTETGRRRGRAGPNGHGTQAAG